MTLHASHEPAWPAAREAAHAAAQPLPPETMPIAEARGRILASDVAALTDLPPRDASAMDGWVVSGTGPWRVVGSLLAGDVLASALAPGEAATIATGTALPVGATGVLRREHGATDEGGSLQGTVAPGQDVRRAGEEARAGDILIRRGLRLTPAHLGMAAAGGHDTVDTIRRPTARFIVFGDELLRHGPARDGKVRDSLGPQVPGWLDLLGVQVIDVQWVPDSLDAHVRALDGARDVDLVITSGGTAAGPVDHVRKALDETGGRLVVDTVAVRPGHPMLLGSWPTSRWLIGLPGNPQAAIAALLTLGEPLIAGLGGRPLTALDTRQVTEPIASRAGTTRLVLCREAAGRCTPTEYIGSGMLRGLSTADGFAVIPAAGARRGDAVPWVPLPG